ncbi:hypothetical protein ACFLU6_12105 [Acidobacteriota bacterium]
MRRYFLSTVLLVVAFAMILGPVAALAGGTNPKFYGKTIGEMAGEWWNWISVHPYSETPPTQNGDVDCSFGQPSGKVWFLAGTFGDPGIERTCSVPGNKALFFPLVNNVMWAPEDCGTTEECRDVAMMSFGEPFGLFCTIDGEPCVYENLLVRTQSSPFTLMMPEDSFFTDWGYMPGDRYPSIADGYWMLLPPLSKGDHVIHFGGIGGDPCGDPTQWFVVDAKYNITAE